MMVSTALTFGQLKERPMNRLEGCISRRLTLSRGGLRSGSYWYDGAEETKYVFTAEAIRGNVIGYEGQGD